MAPMRFVLFLIYLIEDDVCTGFTVDVYFKLIVELGFIK